MVEDSRVQEKKNKQTNGMSSVNATSCAIIMCIIIKEYFNFACDWKCSAVECLLV